MYGQRQVLKTIIDTASPIDPQFNRHHSSFHITKMKLNCFHCERPLTISPAQLGTEVYCPHCGQRLRLPAAEGATAEDPSAANNVTGSWMSNSISGLISVVIHAALFLIFALVTCDFRGGSGNAGEEVLIGELPGVELNESQQEQLDASEAEAQTEQQADELDEMLDLVAPLETSDSELAVDIDLSEFAPSSASGGGSPGIGAITGGGGALGDGASFMGISAKGTRFCIIADNSGSMEGPKLEHVKEEIIETLSTMGNRGRFQLIFFNSREVPYPQSGWQHPRKERAAVARWLQSVTAGGGTYPTPAFRVAMALSPRPDAIFFMTDGQFPDQVVREIRDLNAQGGRRVKVHTISFVDRSAENLMRQIAQESGGKYRHVAGF